MCRLLAIIGITDERVVEASLQKFGMLSNIGNVPTGILPGHKDGWGLVAYRDNQITFLEKEPSAAYESSKYVSAISQLAKLNTPLLIGHVRKASRGKKAMENTQPYVFDSYVFCHNGTIFNHKENLPIEPKFVTSIRGETDSEMLFFWFIQTIKKNKGISDGFEEGARKLHSMKYSAANILMSDGNILFAMREANDRDVDANRKILCDTYYTLFQGKDISGTTKFICSQKLDIPDIIWIEIPNHTILTINTKSREEKTVSL
ncbi:MAG: class II glutamine amidotransferase [Bacteroidota bacterium]|jgi:predicted glutamine amidotransferase